MRHQLKIGLDHCEGALLRLLGTVERRGFTLLELKVDKPDASSYSLCLLLHGLRDPATLCRQLERLIEVHSAQLVAEPWGNPVPGCFQASWL